jgi:hypothetical protein
MSPKSRLSEAVLYCSEGSGRRKDGNSSSHQSIRADEQPSNQQIGLEVIISYLDESLCIKLAAHIFNQ